jgi:hypothetical protein
MLAQTSRWYTEREIFFAASAMQRLKGLYIWFQVFSSMGIQQGGEEIRTDLEEFSVARAATCLILPIPLIYSGLKAARHLTYAHTAMTFD